MIVGGCLAHENVDARDRTEHVDVDRAAVSHDAHVDPAFTNRQTPD